MISEANTPREFSRVNMGLSGCTYLVDFHSQSNLLYTDIWKHVQLLVCQFLLHFILYTYIMLLSNVYYSLLVLGKIKEILLLLYCNNLQGNVGRKYAVYVAYLLEKEFWSKISPRKQN